MLLQLALALQVAAAPQGAELLAPGVLNTDADEYGATLTADGNLMAFTLRADRRGSENIVVSALRAGQWSAPQVAPFSGGGLDKEPYFSPDGRRLFFASRRPWPGKDTTRRGEESYDLFVVERAGAGWGEPRPLADVSSPAYDNYPAVAANGNLYFGSHRARRDNDLYVAPWQGGRYGAVEPVAALNTPATDADPFVAPDESYLIFSTDRPGGAGSGDLVISRRTGNSWSEPVSLGPLVNTADYEYTPWVSADGRWLYFSRGWGEMWRIETSLLEAFRPARR